MNKLSIFWIKLDLSRKLFSLVGPCLTAFHISQTNNCNFDFEVETLIYIFSRQQGKFKSNKEDDRKSGSSPLKVNKIPFLD